MTRLWPVLLAALAAAAPQTGPLGRRYREGEKLAYRMTGSHAQESEVKEYQASATSVVARGPKGGYFEKLTWAPEAAQTVSLDPTFKSAIPDFSKTDPALIGPMSDLLTFFVDYQLAVRKHLAKTGDHAYFPHGKPNSWADGHRVTIGFDCVDFEATLESTATAKGLAFLRVRHVPPPKGCPNPPAPWMADRVMDSANNWFQVTKAADDRFEADYGQETFEARIYVSPDDGRIVSAELDNPILFNTRVCKDAALKDCAPPVRGRILRAIQLATQEDR